MSLEACQIYLIENVLAPFLQNLTGKLWYSFATSRDAKLEIMKSEIPGYFIQISLYFACMIFFEYVLANDWNIFESFVVLPAYFLEVNMGFSS